MKHIIAILSVLAALCIVPRVDGQTGIEVQTGTAAMVARQNGQTAAADLSWVLVPIYNSPPDTNGNVNTFNVRSDAFIPSSPFAWGYYGVGADVMPTKFLNQIGGKVLVPTDSLHLEFNGTVGEYNPDVGNAHVAGMVGGTLAWALNQSGTITWNVVGADYMIGISPSTWGVTSGLNICPFLCSANQQSVKAAKARRAAMTFKKVVGQ
jgi:hypothetical protein